MLLRDILLQTFLVIVASFVLAPVESQMVSVYPPSVAAQRWDHYLLLGCNVTGLPANTYIQWIYYPSWMMTGFLIYSTYDGINNDPTNFTVLPMMTVGDTQSLDLLINTVKPELATQYVCNLSPMPGSGKSIHVVVLDKMYCSNDVVEFDEGKEASISCSVYYHDSTQTYAPMITWKRDGQEVPGVAHFSDDNISKRARLTKNMTSADNDQDFVCVVDFLDSTPNYTDNCYTTVFVRYPVSEITFDPPSSAEAPTNVSVGDVIKCIANGRPAPTIDWYAKDLYWLSAWSELTVRRDMRSWEQPITLYCRANNTFDNGMTLAMVVGIYTFNVVDAEPVIVPSVETTATTAVTTTTSYDAVGEISFYPPSSAEAPAEVAVGAHIICIVDGRPDAEMEWFDKHWNSLSGWSEVTVTEDMRYSEQPITLQCRARIENDHGFTLAVVKGIYTFNVAGAVEAWVIAVAVIVPIVVLAAIAIAVFFIIRHRRMKERSSAMTTMKGGSTSALFVNY